MALSVRVALVGLICCAASAAWAQQTIYVNGTTGDDAWDGLCEEWDGDACGPKATIQAGIDAAVDGDTVLVADGTYTGDGNKDLDFGGRAITVRSESGADTCVIDCEGSGRGFYFHTGEGVDSVVDGFTVRNGFAGSGGGVYCSSSPTITRCTISGNAASVFGGGIECYTSSSLTMTNCTISGNRSNYRGGGVYCHQSSPTFTHCSINGNSAVEGGGGVFCSSSSPTLTNCILWDDTPQEISVHSSEPVVTYCDVQGGWVGAGNIDAAPQFALDADAHLMGGSPCIDAGTHSPPGGLLPEDHDGNPRPLDGDGNATAVVDMGAYEFNPDAPSIAFSPSAFAYHGPHGGLNPDPQVMSIRNCGGTTLNWQVVESSPWLGVTPTSGQSMDEVNEVVVSVDTSGLAWGEYRCALEVSDASAVNSPRLVVVILYVNETLHVPAEYATIQAAIDPTVDGDTVIVAEGTYTGDGNKGLDFGGKAITVRSESGPETCIINCEGNGRGFYFHNGEGADSIVDGLTICNGSISIGGGVFCSGYSSPTITNCTISGNSAGAYGGGIYYSYSILTITNCTISGNSAGTYGGGIWNHVSSPTITNCVISGNSAGTNGGGAYCISGSPTIINCTISGNSAGGNGGGLCCELSTTPTITNSILWGDAPQEIYIYSGSPVVTYCDVQGGWSGEGNIDADPLFLDPDGPDEDPSTWEDNDYRLSAGSLCIDAGNNDALPPDAPDLDGDGDTDEPIPVDLDGHARILNGMVDMGAYEFGIGDFDGNQVVDLLDFASWEYCTTGPGGEPYAPGCEAFDFEYDSDVDLADFVGFQAAFAQP